MKVTIIGLGLIGGSMAIDLKRRGFADEVIGVEKDPISASAAMTIGLVDKVVSLEEGISQGDIIVIAVPVGIALKMLPSILDSFADMSSCDGCRKIVIDVCSTKNQLLDAVEGHPMRERYVATHPMAGTEYSGPWAAMPGLFDGKASIICDVVHSDPAAVEVVEELYTVLNMRTIVMDAGSHDVHAAYVSHISHVTSFALALTVLDKEKDDKHIFDLASGGFSSTVRLAKSNPDMWVPILSRNKENLLHVMDTYIDNMKAFREAIADDDEAAIRRLIEDANKIKRIIK